ncbi:MAG: bifunctional 2-polyprenyl-6-hydroxyphenol methylase/3-demethylubiquinol 3-O-methyltransferase UbiG [Thermodesulfobacteriota bacterium]
MSSAESQKFDDLSREWWDPKGRLGALHRINPLRFSYFAGIMGCLEGKRVVDIGCGGGVLAEEFAKAGAEVTGIDLSPLSIDVAREHARQSGLSIDYRVLPVAQLLEEGGASYDAVICAEVLEHVDDLEAFLRDAAALLKEGGHFFFGTINRTIRARFFAIFMAESVLGMVPPGIHHFDKFIKPSTLVNILRHNGVTVEEIRGMTYDLLRMDFTVSDDTTINYMGYGINSQN